MARPSKPFLDRFLEGLTDQEEAAAYINAARGDSEEMFRTAILDVARAHQIAKVARAAGVTREHLYRSLSPRGNPTEATLNAVLRSIGLDRGDVRPIAPKKARVSAFPLASRTARGRISRSRRATASKYQLAFDFENPQGLGQSSNPILRIIGEPIAAAKGTVNFMWFLGNADWTVGRLGEVRQRTSVQSEWLSYLQSASAEGMTRIFTEAR